MYKGYRMKKMFLLLTLLCLSIASKAAEDLSAETLFPNAAQGMKLAKFKIIKMLQTGNLEQAYSSLSVANQLTLLYFFDQNTYLSTRTIDGKNLLHLACENGAQILACSLYRNNSDLLRELDRNEHTPLYYACKNGHNAIVDEINPTSLEEFIPQDQQIALYAIPGNYWEQRRLQQEFDLMR